MELIFNYDEGNVLLANMAQETIQKVIGGMGFPKKINFLDPKTGINHEYSTLIVSTPPKPKEELKAQVKTPTHPPLFPYSEGKPVVSRSQMIEVASSNLKKVGFARQIYTDYGTLEVEFKNGSRYEYYDIPNSIFQALLASSSKGSYFNMAIAQNKSYLYKEIK